MKSLKSNLKEKKGKKLNQSNPINDTSILHHWNIRGKNITTKAS